jgi:hypothetical protein
VRERERDNANEQEEKEGRNVAEQPNNNMHVYYNISPGLKMTQFDVPYLIPRFFP